MTSQYPLTNAEKINHASQILDRGLMVINKYIPNETEYTNFRQAEANGKVNEYFLSASYLSTEQRHLLSKYYEINAIIGKMRMEQDYELAITGDASFPLYKKAVEIGITEEKRVIEKYFQDHSNYDKLIKIVSHQIEEIKKNADDIIALDPEFSIENSFREEERNDLEYLKTLSSDDLCLFGLRKIRFDFSGNCFDIDNQEVVRLLEKEFFTWAKMEVEYSDLPQEQKNQIFYNNKLFLHFFTQRIRILDSAILLALWYNRMPQEYKFNVGTLFILWNIAKMYEENKENSLDFCILDTVSIKNIYLFILDLFQELEQENELNEVPEPIEIMFFSVKSLAKIYSELYDYEKSIELYKSLFFTEKLLAFTLDSFDYIILSIVECYEKINLNKAINFILDVITDKSDFFAIPIDIDENTKDILELKLAGILSENPEIISILSKILEEKGTLKFNNDFINEFIKINIDVLKTDNIDSEHLAEITILANNFAEKLYKQNELGNVGITTQLRIFQSTPLGENPDFLAQKIEQIEKLLTTTSNKYSSEKIEIEFWKAKVEFLRGNSICLILFKQNLQLAEQDGVSVENLNYWYCQYIRANVLHIKDKFDTAYSEIEQYALKAANLLLKTSISNFGRDLKALSTQVEFEMLIVCILSNIERIYSGEIKTGYIHWTPETEITQLAKNENKLLKLVWNLLSHRNKYLNAFYSYKQADNYFSKRFKELQSQNQENLYHYHILGKLEYKNKITIASNEFKQMQVPYLIESNFLNELQEPTNRSIFYFVLTKQDTMRGMIAISFHPIGHQNSGTKFQYKHYEDISSLENVLANANSDDVKSLFRNQDDLKVFYDYLIKPFDLTDNHREYSTNQLFKELMDMGFTEDKIEMQSEQVDIYNDSFLNRLSFEYLNTDEKFPIGILKKISYVVNKPQREIYPNFAKPIIIFSEIPEYPKFKFLENSIQEVTNIKKLSTTQKIISVVGSEANLSNFYANLEKKPSILHFITHGVGDANLPSETSALLLAPDGENGKICFLSYLDILKLDLSFVDLVVLSACNSSIGKIDRGISMKGLAYAFLYAGVGNVLATKTEVSDKFTSPFISKFYNYLFDNNSVAETLRLTREYFHQTNYTDFGKAEWGKAFLSSWNLWS